MTGVPAETEFEEVHRLTADEYHQMIEAGGFDEDARIELIDGLLVDMSPKTPAHERDSLHRRSALRRDRSGSVRHRGRCSAVVG